MIRINLLGVTKPKKGKRGGVSVPSFGDGPNPMLVALIVGVLTVGAIGGWYWKLDSDAKKIKADTEAADRENKRLATVKVKYEQRKKEADLYERRVKVIDELRSNQSGPVTLLAMIGDTVNNTEAVWLNLMKEDGSKVNLEGVALSTQAVANLMANLKKSGQFKTVEIKETFQDPSQREMQAFNFTLICEREKKS